MSGYRKAFNTLNHQMPSLVAIDVERWPHLKQFASCISIRPNFPLVTQWLPNGKRSPSLAVMISPLHAHPKREDIGRTEKVAGSIPAATILLRFLSIWIQ